MPKGKTRLVQKRRQQVATVPALELGGSSTALLRSHWTGQPPLISSADNSALAMADPVVLAESARILRQDSMDERTESQILSSDPLIYIIDDFLSAAECEYITGLADPQMSRAVVTGAKGNSVTSDRTSRVAWLPNPSIDRGTGSLGELSGPVAGDGTDGDVDELLVEVEERICALLGCRSECMEPFQVIHYLPGQEYSEHVDGYDATTEHGLANCTRGGNRLVTALMYLNDVEAGGETLFSELEISVQPRQGRVLIFHNCTADSPRKVDPRTLHAGTPVEAGEKWAANKWLRMFPLRSPGRYDYVR